MMKITYKEGQACPVITCDWCNQEIEDALQATYAFVMAVGRGADMQCPDESEIYHVHNGKCFAAFERYKKRTSDIFLGTVPLECLPVYLASNLSVNWLTAYKTSRFMAGYDLSLIERLPKDEWRVLRAQVLKRDQYRCQYCGGKATEVDHVLPISKGGGNEPTNLVAACYGCNRGKSAKSVEEFIDAKAP